MASETATPARNLGPEFWAVIGTAVAIAMLILTVAGWQRADMRALDLKLETIQEGQGSIRERLKAVEVGQSAIRDHLLGVEARIGAAVVEPESTGDLAAVVGADAATP